jgi:hypothetical protein
MNNPKISEVYIVISKWLVTYFLLDIKAKILFEVVYHQGQIFQDQLCLSDCFKCPIVQTKTKRNLNWSFFCHLIGKRPFLNIGKTKTSLLLIQTEFLQSISCFLAL